MKEVSENMPENQKNLAGGDPQQPAPPVKALQDAQVVPKTLVGSETGRMTLRFNPDLSYVKVKFKRDNPDIKIECEEDIGEDGVFELRFDQGNQRARDFDLWVRTIEKESVESIVISCQDENGKALGSPFRLKVTFKPAPAPIDSWVGLLHWFISWRKGWYVKYPIALLVIIGVMFYRGTPPAGSVKARLRPKIENSLIWIGYHSPRHHASSIPEPFNARPDNRPDPKVWDAPQVWSLTDGEGGNKTNNALLVNGKEVGLIRLPELSSLYDYHALLRMNVTANQCSASWVLRAQDKKDFYLFTFTLPEGNSTEAELRGDIYENGVQVGNLTIIDDKNPIQYYRLREGSIVQVNIEIKGNTFTHVIQLLSVPDFRDPNYGVGGGGYVGKEYKRTFSDLSVRDGKYQYGTFGFKGAESNCSTSNGGNQFKIESLYIDNVR